MRKALALVAVAAMSVTVASPSLAAVKPKPKPKLLPKAVAITVSDPAGDANGINDNFGLLPAAPPEQSSPQGERTAADILSYTITRLDDTKQVLGFIGSLTLAAAPDQGTDYRIRLDVPGCSTYFLEYEYAPGLAPAGEIRQNCTGTTVFSPADVKVVDKTITWTVPLKTAPGGLKVGTVITVHGAQTSGETAVIIPTIDQAKNEATYKIGQ